MTKFRVLVIPGRIDQGLDVLAEMLRLSNLGNNSANLSVEVVTPSRATELDLVNLLRVQGQKFDCLHLLGHSDGSTFELASGDVLTEDHILSLCKDAGAKVLFMNSCASAALCQYAVNTTVAVALAWVGGVVDNDAIVAAIRFYSAISDLGDPWGSGLRRAYEAAGEKRRLLWLTDGEYVSQIVAPLVARLDAFDKERTEAFKRFGEKLDALADQSTATSTGLMAALATIKDQVQSRFVEFSSSHKRLRVTLYAVLAIIVVIAALVAYSIMRAQTVPPTPTLLPGCGASGGQPKKCDTDTPIPTDTLASQATDTPQPTDTKEEPTPTDTPQPTNTKEEPTPTNTPRPTNTKEEPTPQPTDTPLPTVELPTLTPTETEIPPCPQ